MSRNTDRSPRRRKISSEAIEALNLDFSGSPVAWKFLNNDSFFRGIMGPVGSGKSYACAAEVMLRAIKQPPAKDGIRYSRFAVIRNSYPELRTTTLKTWGDLFPESQFGPLRWSPPITHHIKLPKRGEALGVDCEVIFLALDQPRDVRKLLSLELTGAWCNEARELSLPIIQTLSSRCGRYPPQSKGGSLNRWRGIWADTNGMGDDHWWHRLAEREPVRGKFKWVFFRQPAGMITCSADDEEAVPAAKHWWRDNSKAENIANLPIGYYEQQLGGKDLDWIKCYVGGEYVFVSEGKAVWPEYTDSEMNAENIQIDYGAPIIVGLDFGLTPAAVFCQRDGDGRWKILYELVAKDMGLANFAQHLLYELNTRFDKLEPEIWGDPAGTARDQIWEVTAFDHLQSLGLKANPTVSNDFQVRREAGAAPMTRMVKGKPGLIVDSSCKQLRRALAGGYHFKRVAQAGGGDRFRDKPLKDMHSHIGDAFGYAMLGGGEHRELVRNSHRPKKHNATITAPSNFNVW